MNKSKKGLTIAMFIAFVVLFVCSTLCAFVYVPTASAMTSVTTFTTTQYLAQQYFYDSSLTSGNNLLTTWYFTFDVESSGLGFYLYTVDHNYNTNPTRVELLGRAYDNGNLTTNYFISLYGSGQRYADYILEYENYVDIITNVQPQYLTISYSSVALSRYDWTIKRVYDSTSSTYGGYVIAHYTWGNNQYRFTYSFVVRTTLALAQGLDNGTTPIPNDTMYYSADLTESNQYNNGYNQGFTDGVRDQFNKVDKNSASYKQGLLDGINDNNPFSFVGLFGGIADAQLSIIDGLLGFEFLGVNVLSLFKVIITLGLVYGVFRLIKG